MIISLVIPGEPQVKERPRCGKRVRSTPRQVVAEEEIARLFQARYIVPEMYDGPVRLEIIFHTRSKAKDWDNMAKLVSDALNGVLWRDDRQITSALVILDRFAVEPHTVIEATVMDGAAIERGA